MSRAALPPPLTASAREARFAFYCTLCSKGYSRIHEFEAHENSYDHQHKKRFLEMKALQKKPARRGSNDRSLGAGGVKPITLNLGGEKTGVKKKGGFKSAFGGGEVKVEGVPKADENEERRRAEEEPVEESDDEGWGGYDPAQPTGV
jgi:hypothetical protein